MDTTKDIIAQVVTKLLETQISDQNIEILKSLSEIKEIQLDVLSNLKQSIYATMSCNTIEDLKKLVSDIKEQDIDIRAHPVELENLTQEQLIKIRNGCNPYYVFKKDSKLLQSIIGKENLYFQILVLILPELFESLQPYVERMCCNDKQ